MDVDKKKFVEKNTLKILDRIFRVFFQGEMAERLKAVDCKSIEISHRRFKSYFLLF